MNRIQQAYIDQKRRMAALRSLSPDARGGFSWTELLFSYVLWSMAVLGFVGCRAIQTFMWGDWTGFIAFGLSFVGLLYATNFLADRLSVRLAAEGWSGKI